MLWLQDVNGHVFNPLQYRKRGKLDYVDELCCLLFKNLICVIVSFFVMICQSVVCNIFVLFCVKIK